MPLVQHYDPPAHLADVDANPPQREAWHQYINDVFFRQISRLGDDLEAAPHGLRPTAPPFYNGHLVDPGAVIELDLVWNAFPLELLRRFGHRRAVIEADRVWPLSAFTPDLRLDPSAGPGNGQYPQDVFYRPTTEYCEWQVDRRGRGGRIRRITFSCEPAEYWQALGGGRLPDGSSDIHFPGDRKLLLHLYRTLVDKRIQMDDITVQRPFFSPLGQLTRGAYNPYNRWNVGRGIVHMTAPPNALKAEIELAASATALVVDDLGRPFVRPEEVATRTGMCSSNRNSDMAILSGINALARSGHRVTLTNPVGVYIDRIDLSGWELPRGIRAEDCVRISRGGGRSITRLVVQVPSRRYDLQHVSINGVPVTSGGQIASCITLRLRASASVSRNLPPRPQPVHGAAPAFVAPADGHWLFQTSQLAIPPQGWVPAFGRSAALDIRPPQPRTTYLTTRAMS